MLTTLRQSSNRGTDTTQVDSSLMRWVGVGSSGFSQFWCVDHAVNIILRLISGLVWLDRNTLSLLRARKLFDGNLGEEISPSTKVNGKFEFSLYTLFTLLARYHSLHSPFKTMPDASIFASCQLDFNIYGRCLWQTLSSVHDHHFCF